jgi:hypothetical protein
MHPIRWAPTILVRTHSGHEKEYTVLIFAQKMILKQPNGYIGGNMIFSNAMKYGPR